MKKIFLPVIIILFQIPVFAQQIENIRVEKDADKVNIYYDLLDAAPNTRYTVSIYCSINGEARLLLMKVSGNVGSGIITGTNKRIVWEAKTELNESELSKIKNIEFFIRADKQNETTIPSEKRDRKYFVGYSGSLVDYLGGKIGIVKNWGGYVSLRILDSYSVSGGVIMKIPKSFFCIYAGTGIGNWGWLYDPGSDAVDYWSSHSAVEANAGAMLKFEMFYLEAGTSVLISKRGTFPDFTFGLGLLF